MSKLAFISSPVFFLHGLTRYTRGLNPPVTSPLVPSPNRTSEPEADERKLMGFKWMTMLSVMFFFTWYYKRVKWSVVKNRRLELF